MSEQELVKREAGPVMEGERSTAGSPAALIELATKQGAGIEVVERLAKLYEAEREDVRRKEYNVAMTAAQMEMRPISADAENKQTRSKYATYAQLDKALRPVYTKHGFGLSFDTQDSREGMVRVVCIVSHKDGYERTHHIDMPSDGKGAKGGDVMTKTHATGAAMSYGMRYLLKMIFNVSVGEDDRDGNEGGNASFITPAQAKTLRSLLKACGPTAESIETSMLGWANAECIDELPARLFAQCQKALLRHKKEFEKGDNLPYTE